MNKGEEDCYFFYNAVCNKGDRCPFRHCKAALGSRTVCSLWRENRCFRKACKFRHTELNDDHKDTYCHFETRSNGCFRVDCRFYHVMPRDIDGLHLPADKGPVPKGRCGVKARQQKSITTSSRPTSRKNRYDEIKTERRVLAKMVLKATNEAAESTADVEKSHKLKAVSPDNKRPLKWAKACRGKTAEGKGTVKVCFSARPESDVVRTPTLVTCSWKRKATATSAPLSKPFKASCLEAEVSRAVAGTTHAPVMCGRKRKATATATSATLSKRFRDSCLEAEVSRAVAGTTPAPVTCGRKRKATATATSALPSKCFKASCLEASCLESEMEALVCQFEALSLGP